jgi:hypothetical protein
MSRRTFLKAATRMTAGAALASATGSAYAAWLEPQWIAVEPVDIRLKRLPPAFDGFRIAQLSDVHYDTTPAATVAAAIDAANQLDADAVVLTGDYLSGSLRSLDECAAEIGRLRAKLGVFGVLGNHDVWSGRPNQIAGALEANGVTMLRNRSIAFERDGSRLWIVGMDDGWERQADPDRALRGAPGDEAKLLLLHEPDFADAMAHYSIDAQLSGHSHGGQVRLPLIGAPILPPYGRKYPYGLRRVARLQLYTSRGVGVIRPAVRFNCRPEVTLVTLRSASRDA